MKKVVLFCIICFSSILVNSQERSSLSVMGQSPKLLYVAHDRSGLNTYHHQQSTLDQILLNKPHQISVQVPIHNQYVILNLQAADWYHNDIEVKDKLGKSYPLPESMYYHGSIAGVPDGMVSLAVFKHELRLTVSTDIDHIEFHQLDGTYVMTSNPTSSRTKSCKTPEMEYRGPTQQVANRSFADCIEIMLEADYDLFVAAGSSGTNTVNYMTSIFNSVAAVYALEGIPLSLKSIVFNSVPDNYPTTLTGVLQQFVTNLSAGFNGKIAYLMSAKNLGGGIAQGVGGFCNGLTSYPGPFAIGGDYTYPSIAYPTFSEEVLLMAHEIGHVMGLRHTHACVWNGDNSQVDDCGNVVAVNQGNTPEGASCFDASNAILPGSNGTVMSMCHMLPGNAINLSLGFGNEVGELLAQNYAFASCETGSDCTNLPPANDACAFATPLQVTNTCSLRTFDNLLATASGASPSFTCGTIGAGLDVWFSVIVPESGNVTIQTGDVPSGLTDMIVQAYSGSCANLQTILCDDNSGPGNHALLSITNRLPGERIFLRVVESGSNQSGDFGICAFDSSIPCHPDFDFMVDFYTNTNGTNWTNNAGWAAGAAGTNCSVCNWFGVVCDNAGRVVELNLPNNNLVGSIPSALGRIDKLRRINLANNNLSGTLPIFLPQLLLLSYLDLGNNSFTGNIPLTWASLNNLRSLYLDQNNLSGTLPSVVVSTPVTNLWLNDNNFSGCIPSSYYQLCQRQAAVRIEDNPSLPFGGDYASLCQDSIGADIDQDGFCGGSNDCNDTDATIFPNAPELCDGKDNNCDTLIDNGAPVTINNWLALTDDWHLGTNWSTGFIPQACHDVNILPVTTDSCIVFANKSATANSITIGINGILHIQNFSNVFIAQRAGLTNNGTLSNYGKLSINQSSAVSLANQGVLLNGLSGQLSIISPTMTGLTNSGFITNFGSILVQQPIPNFQAIINTGIIDNYNFVRVEE